MYIPRLRHEEKNTYISVVSKTVVLDMVSSRREELEKDVNAEKDCADRKHTHFYRFNGYDKVIGLIEKLPLNINVSRDKERSLAQLSSICDSYQEQPHLIDPFLGEIFAKIATIIAQCIDQHAVLIKSEQDRETKSRLEQNDALINQAFKYMYTLAVMRNCKRATEFLPSMTNGLERLLSLLERQNAKDANSRQTRFMLLLWLSTVHRDSNVSDANSEKMDETLANRVLNICFPYLYATDNCQDASAFMLAKFMPTIDLEPFVLPKFFDKLHNLIGEGINESNSIKLLGSLKCLGYLYKYGKREMLVKYAPTTLQVVMTPAQLASNHLAIVRKFHVKLAQRIGVIFFPLGAAKWRYVRSLLKVTDPAQDASSSDKIQDQEGDEKAPVEIEDIISLILKGLKDRDAKLRWSSAKSLARIANCLSKDRAEGVLASVVALFKLDDEDLSWHGGCLAIAELCHQGLVLPLQLSSVVPVILKALLLDQKVGNYTLGRNVREYACYVCWTLARVFETRIIQQFTNQITSCLLMVTIFDSDGNCRRAASAAFQEMIGRHGQLAYDVEILTNCDFDAVGRIQNCYLHLSVFVSQFGDYRRLIFDHLLGYKFNHWDHTIRKLTSQALFNLSKTDPEYMTSEIVPALLKHSLSTDANTRHGALLSLAEVIDALSKEAARLSTTPEEHSKLFNRFFPSSLINQIKDVLNKIFDRKCRGSEAELIRPALCFLIKKLVMSQLFNQPLSNQTSNSNLEETFIRDLGEFLDQSLEYNHDNIQVAAVETIPYYCDLRFGKSCDSSSVDMLLVKESKLIEKFARKLISTSKQTIRSGYCLAIGSLPRYFLQVDGNFAKAIDILIESCKIKPLYSLQIDKYFRDEPGEPVKSHVGTAGNVDCVNVWVQARKDAITALIKLLGLLKTKQDFELFGMSSSLLLSIFDSLLSGLNDYTIDSSGDSGSKVREASIVALQVLIEQCGECGITDLASNETLLISIFSGIIQQAVERIDRTRNVAGTSFAKILYSKHLRLEDFEFSKSIRTVFHGHVCKTMNWNAAHLTSPLFVKLLEIEAVQARLLSGLIYSMGSLSIHLVKSVTTAFLKELQSLKIKKEAEFRTVMSRLLELARSKIGSERYALSIIKAVDLVIQNNLLDGEHLNKDCHFPVEFLNLFIENVKTAKDVQKLTAYVDAFADMLQFEEDRVRERAMIQLMILLCNQYPSIRKATATKLYEALISYSEIVVDEENLDECTTLLMETSWDRPLDTVRPIRDRLCEMTNTPKPVIKKKTQN